MGRWDVIFVPFSEKDTYTTDLSIILGILGKTKLSICSSMVLDDILINAKKIKTSYKKTDLGRFF